MVRHPIRKLFGLALLYIIIIFGIFALQFRNRSIFSQNFGNLHLTLSENKTANNKIEFADAFQVYFKGINLFTDKNNHIQITNSTQKNQSLTFNNWKQLSDTSIELYFSNNFTLQFSILGKDSETLQVSIKTNQKYSELSIPYLCSGTYTISNRTDKYAILSNKDSHMIFSAPRMTTDRIYFTQTQHIATSANYDPKKSFTFTALTSPTQKDEEEFISATRQIASQVLLQVQGNHDPISEKAITAYIAEMADQGRYIEAINNVPDSFKNASRRTYLTAPQLNNLVEMNKSLIMYNENLAYKIEHSLTAKSLEFFEVDQLYAFILRQKTSIAENILSLPNNLFNNSAFQPTLMQATGILQTYCDLYKTAGQLADKLKPVLQECILVIEKSISVQDKSIFIKENNIITSFANATKIAVALIDYSEIIKNSAYRTAGYKLFTSHSEAKTSLDINEIGNIYTIINHNNTYIPHQVLLQPKNKPQITAWTIAQSLNCTTDAEGTISLFINFPTGASHYMIINGVEPFTAIEIYGMQFRTDSRFESYNSSGYVYNSRTKTLFLKTKQKASRETVKLFYKSKTEPAPISEPTPSQKNDEEKTVTTETKEAETDLPQEIEQEN